MTVVRAGACQTISEVMSPKGEKTPPALAATTMAMQPMTMNWQLPTPDRHDLGAHHERCGQIVDDRAEDEGKPSHQPEELPVGELQADQLGPQRLEDAPLLHRVDVGDRHDQKQHQLTIVDDRVPGRGFERGALPMRGVDEARGAQMSPAASMTGFDFCIWMAFSTVTKA